MTLNDISKQIEDTKGHLSKGLEHLKYSFEKTSKLPRDYDIEDLKILLN